MKATSYRGVRTGASSVEIMSAVWLKIAAFFCLGCTAPAAAGTNKVEWKDVGKSITIPCKTSADVDTLYLKKGLGKQIEIFYTEKTEKKVNIYTEIKSRVQVDMKFPNVDILIKNLTVNDTGPYWCVYSTYSHSQPPKEADGILLVVTDKHKPIKQCEPSHLNMVITIVVAVATVLLCFLLLLIIWTKQKPRKPFCRSTKPSVRTNNNDVYEDMRGTIRR